MLIQIGEVYSPDNDWFHVYLPRGDIFPVGAMLNTADFYKYYHNKLPPEDHTVPFYSGLWFVRSGFGRGVTQNLSRIAEFSISKQDVAHTSDAEYIYCSNYAAVEDVYRGWTYRVSRTGFCYDVDTSSYLWMVMIPIEVASLVLEQERQPKPKYMDVLHIPLALYPFLQVWVREDLEYSDSLIGKRWRKYWKPVFEQVGLRDIRYITSDYSEFKYRPTIKHLNKIKSRWNNL